MLHCDDIATVPPFNFDDDERIDDNFYDGTLYSVFSSITTHVQEHCGFVGITPSVLIIIIIVNHCA